MAMNERKCVSSHGAALSFGNKTRSFYLGIQFLTNSIEYIVFF